jgi:AcrR family transcriptional regulator
MNVRFIYPGTAANVMPKVTEAHLEARKQQIVDAAFLCFARKGFHPTTMQDICAEAELSSGAVYRYFESKEAIIQSACDASQAASDVDMLGRSLSERDTRLLLKGLVETFFSRFDEPGAEVVNRSMLQLWAEAAVNPRIRESHGERFKVIKDGMLGVVREAQRRGDFNPALSTEAIGIAMHAMYDGFRLQKANDPTLDTHAYTEVVVAMLTGAFWTGATADDREA